MRTLATVALGIWAAATLTAPATAQVPVVPIELKSFAYAPSPIHLRAGQPVTLNFVNRSKSGHDFTAKSFFKAARIVSGTAAEGEVELKGGQSKSVTLIPAAGRYKVHCGHTLHSTFGMRTEILVD